MAKSLTQKDALTDIGLVTGGFVAGAVLPTLAVRAFNRAGIMTGAGGKVAQVGIGIGASAVAGVSVGVLLKDRSAGVMVAAGGVAGILGVLIIQQLNKLLSPLGISVLGDFPTPRAVLTAPAEFEPGGGFPTLKAVSRARTMYEPEGGFPTVPVIEAAAESAGIGDFVPASVALRAEPVMPGTTKQLVGMGDFLTTGGVIEAAGVMGDFVPASVALRAKPVQEGTTKQLAGLGGTTAGSASQMRSVAQMFGLSGAESAQDMADEMDSFGYAD